MIRPAEIEELSALFCDDPFFTRILSLYESYGGGYDFVGFWVQELDDYITAAISRFEDKFSIYMTDAADKEEIAAYLRFRGAPAVMMNAEYKLDIAPKEKITGQVLRYFGEDYISELELYQPDTSELYELLKSCESPIFRVPPRLSFLSDVTHRLNLNKCRIIGTKADGVLASSVMTVSETSCAAILGAVATHPDHRRKGLSRELVKTLASSIKRQGRAVYVFSASEANTRFYENSGFKTVSEFEELFPV